MRIAFVTHTGLSELAPDDQAILPFLTPEARAWNDPHTSWTDFDAVVLRSTWDYHLHHDRFQNWLAQLQAHGVKVLNPVQLVQWNTNKVYLQELEAKGVPIIPTRFVEGHQRDQLPQILQEMGGEAQVVKPAISAAAHLTFRVQGSLSAEQLAELHHLPEDVVILVQPFMPEIAEVGEHSLIFFNGVFSHASLKVPGQGDFRVQGMHGGQTHPTEVDSRLIEQAAAVLKHLPEVPLYARVDGLVRDGQLLLMELELIEPNLFLKTHPDAARNFAQALQQRLQ